MTKDSFIVQHTAKDVEYTVNGFRLKNKDEISQAIQDIMSNSTFPEVSKIWKCLCKEEKEDTKAAKPNPREKFLGYKFRTQMKELMDELNSCECHFIRCIKPNDKKEPNLFNPAMSLLQIKYMGILDTIKVRKESYPIRRLYKVFYERYQDLDLKASKIPFKEHIAKGSDFKELSTKICRSTIPEMEPDFFLIGDTRTFMKMEAVAMLDKKRQERVNEIS
jgi:myosin heavy subunit